MEFLRACLMPWYLEIKFVHVVAMAAWIWSTSVAYLYYLVPAFKAWLRQPEDADAIQLRNWAMDRFDSGAVIEHIAFPILLVSGLLLFWLGGWSSQSDWLMLKLLIVFGLFLPIEIVDYYFAHFGGNKRRALSEAGDAARERKMRQHWWFLMASTAPIVFFTTVVVFLAITKPAL